MLKIIDIGDTVINFNHNEKGYVLNTLYNKDIFILLHTNGVKLFYSFASNVIHSRIVLIERWQNLNDTI